MNDPVAETLDKELTRRKINLSREVRSVCLMVIHACLDGPTPSDGVPLPFIASKLSPEAVARLEAAIAEIKDKPHKIMVIEPVPTSDGLFGLHGPECFRDPGPCKHETPNPHATYDPTR